MLQNEAQLGLHELLKLATESYADHQFETARQFAQRALMSAEALRDVELEIRSRHMLMACCSATGEGEEAIAQAAALLEFLYTPDALSGIKNQDHVLELILSAFPMAVLSTILSKVVEVILGKPEVLERLFRVVNEGFGTLDQLGRNESLQTLYFVRGQLEYFGGNYDAALHDHERAWSLWERVPEGRLLGSESIQLALAGDYYRLGQHEEAQTRYERIAQDRSYGPVARLSASLDLSLHFLNEGKVNEAEAMAQQALQLVKEMESPVRSGWGSICLFEVLLEVGKGAPLVRDAADLLRLLRRFRGLSSLSAVRQVAYSQCGEIRLQQVLSESGLPISYELLDGRMPSLSWSVRRRHIRLTRQAVRWFTRVSAFRQTKELDFATHLLTSLTEDSNSIHS